MFAGKKITVGITGGIAAYKAADLVSWLVSGGADVQVVMTKDACQFITPLTLKTLSHHPVGTDIMSEDAYWQVPHIDCAKCDLFLVVPATANLIAKAAHGMADDLLSAALLAVQAPVMIAPAMNTHMYENPATIANLATLRDRGWMIIPPGCGKLACGVTGVGRLADMADIKDYICDYFATEQVLVGKKVVISAGPTYEYLDPVRFIGNCSSGKMGFAIAEAARQAGADVTLVAGPVSLPAPVGINYLKVISAREMYDAIWNIYPDADIVIMAAAVADYRPLAVAKAKIKKGEDNMDLRLIRNPDILASLGSEKGGKILIGFAAETENLAGYASEKLRQKNLDMIIANDVSQTGAGFDVDTNIITIIKAKKEEANGEMIESIQSYPLMSKKEAAKLIIEQITTLPSFRRN